MTRVAVKPGDAFSRQYKMEPACYEHAIITSISRAYVTAVFLYNGTSDVRRLGWSTHDASPAYVDWWTHVGFVQL